MSEHVAASEAATEANGHDGVQERVSGCDHFHDDMVEGTLGVQNPSTLTAGEEKWTRASSHHDEEAAGS